MPNKVSHQDIINLISLFGYNDDGKCDNGVCFGYALAWIYAVLAHDESTFYARLGLIASYNGDLAKLKNDFDIAKNQKDRPLSKEQEVLLTLPNFIERILLNQVPEKYQDLFGKVIQQNIFSLACSEGSLDTVKTVLKLNCIDINKGTTTGETPLYLACQNGHLNVVDQLLLCPDILVNQARDDGETPLHVACYKGYLNIVKKLLKRADILVNQSAEGGYSPLLIACEQGNFEIVKELLERDDIDLDKTNNAGLSALDIAKENGNDEIVNAINKKINEKLKYKITHYDLTNLFTYLGYNSNPIHNYINGICHGFSIAWVYAVLCNEEEKFYQRLDFIAKYKDNFNILANEIAAAKEKIKNSLPLTEMEQKLIDILSFVERIALHHKPYYYTELFHGFINQNDFQKISPFAGPVNLDNVILQQAIAGGRKKIYKYFTNLAALLEKHQLSKPIVLAGYNHTVCLKYDYIRKAWIYCDTNNFSRYSSDKKYFQVCNNLSLVKNLFRAFGNGRNIVFSLNILSNEPVDNKTLIKINNFKKRYPITQRQLNFYDAYHFGLILLAFRQGMSNEVNDIIKFADVNYSNKDIENGSTPLYLACLSGYLDIVKKLLACKDILVNKPIKDGWTPLLAACRNNQLDVVKELLKRPDLLVNQSNVDGLNALHIVCQTGNLEIFHELLNRNDILVNQTVQGFTPLKLALHYGNHSIVKELLRRDDLVLTAEEAPDLLLMANQKNYDDIVKDIKIKLDFVVIYPAVSKNSIFRHSNNNNSDNTTNKFEFKAN